MNTLINQLFTSFATPDLKSYLGRASDETLDMTGGLVQSSSPTNRRPLPSAKRRP
jgi:hypothetical protein